MRKFWMRIWIGECPLCGRDKGYRERVYGRKPKLWQNRYRYISPEHCYDWCDQ
jgi:hypothetical protein